MDKRCNLFVSSCIFLFITISFPHADEFFIANLRVIQSGKTVENLKTEKAAKLSLDLQEELIKISSRSLNYRPLQSLPKERLGEMGTKTIITTLDALAVCFFADIQYLVYGTINIGENGTYKTSLCLYDRNASRVVDEIVYEDREENDRLHWEGLAAELNEHIKLFMQSPPPQPAKQDTYPAAIIAEAINSATLQTASKPKKPPETSQAIADVKVNDTGPADLEEKSPPPEKQSPPASNNRHWLIYISGGYYLPIVDEWKEKIMPCISIEQGVKFSIPCVESKIFDFMLVPGVLFNYSFALNKPDNPYYTHFHSLTWKINCELELEFNHRFSFFIGGGPQYKVQIIDYVTVASHFMTDIPHALGLFADTGFQFLIGKRKTTAVGITNIFDFTFFAHSYIDFKTQLHLLLRV